MPFRNAVITEQHMVVIRFRQKGLQGSSQFFNIGRIGVKGRYYFQVKSILSLIVSSLHMLNSRLVAAHGIMRVEGTKHHLVHIRVLNRQAAQRLGRRGGSVTHTYINRESGFRDRKS